MGVSVLELDFKDPVKRKRFVKHFLDDLSSMEYMLREGMFEKGINRIGLEQEFCIIDYSLRPLFKNMELISRLKDDHFTTELAKFNLEINLEPRELEGKCLSLYESDLVRLLTKANKHAHKLGGKVILTGILPTIKESDIRIDNITPLQRYYALNEVMTKLRGKDFEFNIQGIDELITKTDSVLFESCNTSFQIHYQINPELFKEYYNWSMAISAPVMACTVNSPIFLKKRLWRETRIALFQQSTDIRNGETTFRDERPRVFFGNDWEKAGILEHYKENLSRFKILLSREIETSSMTEIKEGRIPSLKALSLHNGTIYKWNRACYGVTDSKPHIRIEARYIPAGPTIVDEIANTALWTGLMNGMADEYKTIDSKMHFSEVKSNFYKAAQAGMSAQFKWKSAKLIPARDLILKELIPIAKQGLINAKINTSDIDKYLGIIIERVKSEKTGSQWILTSYAKLKKEHTADESISAITEGMYQRQKIGTPVHKWEHAELKESKNWTSKYLEIGQLMTSDLITVGPDELIDLVRNIMLWSNIRHVPVEDENGIFLGIISAELLLHFFDSKQRLRWEEVEASEIMEKDPLTVSPETLTIDAIRLMRQNELSCLPIVRKDKLVGLFTERDYIKFGEQILEELNFHKGLPNRNI